MIQSPITAFPAGGRASPVQPEARPAGQGGEFGDWLDRAFAADADAPVEEVAPVEAGQEAEAGDLEVEVVEVPVIRIELPSRPVGLSEAAIGPVEDGPADAGMTEPGGGAGIRNPAMPGAEGAAASVQPVEEREGIAQDSRQAVQPAADPGQPADAPNPARPAALVPDAAGQAAPIVALQAGSEAAPALASRATHAPPPAARQVADAVVRMDGELTEITLAPAELGTVRIALSRDANGLVVLLTAERPEALDLLRRHMDLLRQELAAQGEDGARLDFSAQGGGFAQADRRGDARVIGLSPEQPDAPERAETMIRPVLPGRIDMRI